MTVRSNRIDWLVFFALGFMWGSSYLFIKLAVDDFGTFTLVALRLIVGAALIFLVLYFPKGILGSIRDRWARWLP